MCELWADVVSVCIGGGGGEGAKEGSHLAVHGEHVLEQRLHLSLLVLGHGVMRCGSVKDEIGMRCGSDKDEIGMRCGSDKDEIGMRCGSDKDEIGITGHLVQLIR